MAALPRAKAAPHVDATPAALTAARAVGKEAAIEPGRFAIALAFAGVVRERLIAKVAARRVAPRDPVVDTAKGLALVLALVVQFCWEAMRHGAPVFAPVYVVLNLLALPAFMVAAGFFLHKTVRLPWRGYAPRKLT